MGRRSRSRSRTISRSRSRSRSMSSRSRSRSRDRSSRKKRDRSRDRRHRRDRKDRDRKRRRSRSRSRSRNKRQTRSPSAMEVVIDSPPTANSSALFPSGIVVPGEIAAELTAPSTSGGKQQKVGFDSDQLSQPAMAWLEEKIVEQVSARVKEMDELVRDRVGKAKLEMQIQLRAQIEQEMHNELDSLQKKEKESKERCSAMERALEEKIKRVEEAEHKLNSERLQMLEVKGKLEMERAEMQKEREEMNRSEQRSILNKGGDMRAPIKLKLGGGGGGKK